MDPYCLNPLVLLDFILWKNTSLNRLFYLRGQEAFYGVFKFELCFVLQSDVNTVCFADESGHLIYSGSDDALCKVNLTLISGICIWDQLHFSTLFY